MGEGKSGPRHRGGLLGIVLVVVLLGAGTFSAASPSEALACAATNNPDGSHTCSDTFSVTCPTSNGGTTSGFAVFFVPQGSVNIGHQFSLACPGSGISETFDPNAAMPSPPAGDRTVRDDFVVTCNQMGGCGGGLLPATYTVTYNDPTFGGGSTTFVAPGPNWISLPTAPILVKKKKADVLVSWAILDPNFDTEQGLDLGDAFLFLLGGALPKGNDKAGGSSAKKVLVGTLASTHLAGAKGTSVALLLNGKGAAALRAAGKLTVRVTATLRDPAGSASFSGRLRLVAKKSRK
jgi:hypothetical protein